MNSHDLLHLFEDSRHRYHLVGTEANGVIIGLSLEGRLFTILHREVVNRVNPKAFFEQSTKDRYVNPGGDVLWPAPEGSCLGYQYPTGKWRVPPGIIGACYRVISSGKNRVLISAEIDLVNNIGIGIPTIFTREIQVEVQRERLTVKTVEAIEYIGTLHLDNNRCLLGPWSLCQFDCKDGCEVVLPATSKKSVWDLYGASKQYRSLENGLYRIKTEGTHRFQVGISATVEWIEYKDPHKKLRVRRYAQPLDKKFCYFDIADRPPEEKPRKKGVKYSVYNDAGFFMEIEAAGGAASILRQNMISKISVTTVFQKDDTPSHSK